MRHGTRRDRGKSRYSLRFGVTALVLISVTLVLVLVVLPERYVLRPGFRESGSTFPDPATPFSPLPVTMVAARLLPEPPPVIQAGPSELFWRTVVPLIEERRYTDALPVFDLYLAAHPQDLDVRRELAATLAAADRPSDAVAELRRVLDVADDFAGRLAVARMLRDLGRTDEAGAEYARLAEARPDDVELALEHAQLHAWAERYAEAARLLEAALARHPGSARIRVELARVYYASGRLTEGRALLAALDERALAGASGTALRNDIEAALYVPPAPPPVPPTLLERAAALREADDFVLARSLLEHALRESPEDAAVWQAYADLLEYELGDVEGALAALGEVERFSPGDADLQHRLAQLEIWTGRNDAAETRLVALLASLDAGSASGAVTAAEVEAALGDLSRWRGERAAAAERYELALARDLANARARAGLDALEAEVEQTVAEIERPRMGGVAYSLSDTDDFARLDAGGEWIETTGRWVWGGSAGSRWMSGYALDGAAAHRTGAYVELDAGRWWRWGALRTAVDFAAERLTTSWQISLGASISHRGAGVTDLRLERGPAHPLALTLQSVLAEVVQERVALSHTRALGEYWSLAATVEDARLSTDAGSAPSMTPSVTHRAQAAVDIGRTLSTSFTAGAMARSVVLTRPAPRTTLPGGGSARLFWDPNLVVSFAPYAQLTRAVAEDWQLRGRLAPGLAWIDERGPGASDLVPHIAAEAGVRRASERLSATLDLFYSQGQFDGYRAYGARISLSARDVGSAGGR
jgi:thioredoxin-like negative regulator of GroEL